MDHGWIIHQGNDPKQTSKSAQTNVSLSTKWSFCRD